MPILNPNDEEFTGELAADPPVALRSALEASRSAHYDAAHNAFKSSAPPVVVYCWWGPRGADGIQALTTAKSGRMLGFIGAR